MPVSFFMSAKTAIKYSKPSLVTAVYIVHTVEIPVIRCKGKRAVANQVMFHCVSKVIV